MIELEICRINPETGVEKIQIFEATSMVQVNPDTGAREPLDLELFDRDVDDNRLSSRYILWEQARVLFTEIDTPDKPTNLVYKTEEHFAPTNNLVAFLNKQGEEGWEFIQVIDKAAQTFTCLFRQIRA